MAQWNNDALSQEEWSEHEWELFLDQADAGAREGLAEAIDLLPHQPPRPHTPADHAAELDPAARHEIAAYREGHAFSLQLHERFDHIVDREARVDDDVLRAMSAANLAAARVAEGRAANGERAIESLDACLDALSRIQSRQLAPAAHIGALVARAQGVRQSVEAWLGGRGEAGQPSAGAE